MNQLVLAEAATSSTYNFVNALAPCVAKLDGTSRTELLDSLNALSLVQVDLAKLATTINQLSQPIGIQVQEEFLDQQIAALQATGTLETLGPTSVSVLRVVDEARQKEFEDDLLVVKELIGEGALYSGVQPSEATSKGYVTNTAREAIEPLIDELLAVELEEHRVEIETPKRGIIRRIAAMMLRNTGTISVPGEVSADPTDEILARINEVITDIQDDPLKFVASHIMPILRRSIEARACSAARKVIAQNNTEILARIDQELVYRRNGAAAVSAVTERAPETSETDRVSPPGTGDKPELTHVHTSESKIKNIGTIRTAFTWRNEGLPDEVGIAEITAGNGKKAYIIRAFCGSLEKFADQARKSANAKKGELDVYDNLALEVGEEVAYGHNPLANEGITDSLTSKQRSIEYAGVGIRYKRGAMGSRLYFTISEMAKLLTEEELQSRGIDPAAPVVIVIAEANKNNQRKVVKVIQGRV